MGLARGSIDMGFREQNPVICTKMEFKELYEEYTREEADKIMWSIFLIEEPDGDVNPYAKMPRAERIKEVQENFYNIDVEKFSVQLKAYSRWCLSLEESLFAIQRKKIDEMTAYFDQLNLDVDSDFAKYMKISEKLTNIWKNFEAAEKRVLESKKKKTTTFGNTQLSKAEQRRKNR